MNARALLAGLAAALLLAAPSAHGQGLEVSPVSVQMDAPQATTVLSVVNHGRAPVVIQLRPFTWRQADGANQLAPTDELAISPPFAQLAPEQAQTVRIVARRPARDGETTYRLLLDQLPPPSEANGVRLALRISLPVFVKAASAAGPSLDCKLALHGSGATLVIRNLGQVHIKFSSLELLVGNRRIPVALAGNAYVLAGSTMQWTVAERGLPRGSAKLHAVSDAGPIEATLPISADP